MSHIETRRVGRELFVLFVAGPDDQGRWLWWINRIDAHHANTYFGRVIAHGHVGSRDEAMLNLAEAFETHARTASEIVPHTVS